MPVDLIIRGFCCMRPAFPGAPRGFGRSIIGRFLEHSRIFHFAAGAQDRIEGEFYIGSADWMQRNLSHRVEVVTPVNSRVCKKKLQEVLDLCLADPRKRG